MTEKNIQTASTQNGGIKKSCANVGQVICDYHQINELGKTSHGNEMIHQGVGLIIINVCASITKVITIILENVMKFIESLV